MKASFLVWAVLAAAVLYPFLGCSSAPSEGSTAPEIQVAQWVQAPPATTLAELRGRVVFLEFWASW